jgi:acetoin utilization protein AcuB
MQVQDVMTRAVVTTNAHDSIQHARARMHKAGIHHLVVLGRHRDVVGVIGAADLREAPDQGAVCDFMSRRLIIVRPETGVGSAAALMRAHAIGSLPVLRGTRLVGIVTASDMLDVVDRADGMLHRTHA